MQMDAGLDTGPTLLHAAVPLGPRATAAELHDALAALGAQLILRALREWPAATPQPAEGATYAPKLSRADGELDWRLPAAVLDRRVRALNPWPGTWCRIGGEVLKVLAAEPATGAGEPGTVLPGLVVACGESALRLLRVQRSGRSAMAAEDFLRGAPIAAGTLLGA